MSYFGAYYGRYFGAYFGSIGLALVGAWATTTNTIRVTLTASPMAEDPFADGDALNPLTWSVQLGDPVDLTPVGVTMVDSVTFDISVLEPLGTHLDTLTVQPVGLLDAGGSPVSVPAMSLPGSTQTLDPVDRVTGATFRDRDLRNPPFDVSAPGGTGYAGTLLKGPDGDYQSEAGQPMVRKLLLRRLGTKRDAFRHLPGYGVGLVEKEPIPSGGDLQAIRKDILDQAQSEPDVDAATCSLSIDRNNVLIVDLAAHLTGGGSLNVRLASVGGALVEV